MFIISRLDKIRPLLEVKTVQAVNMMNYLYSKLYDRIISNSNNGHGLYEIEIWIRVSHRFDPLITYCIFQLVGNQF